MTDEPEQQLDFDLELRNDHTEAIVEDLRVGLEEAFFIEPTTFGLRRDLHAGGERITNGRSTAYAWQVTARPKPKYWGVLNEPVVINGTTFVVAGDGAPQFARYIDWHSIFVDLGVAGAARVVNDPTDS
ncbi:MAG: hypothetical protein AAGF73_15015 [Actinomycetota bacterium]